MSEYLNKYPVVLLHGMFGWGQQQATSKVFPYFGLLNTNVCKWFEKELGVPCVAPSLGPFTSAWNRACEAYAQLKGGTVDYGKAHAEKYGMKRYGKTYPKPMLPQWGTLDENGDLVKVNLIGHSFGGVTSRMLAELIVNGSEEERAVTDPDDLSELFKGGHEGWVHSITALAAPHNGMTSVEGNVGVIMRHICRFLSDAVNLIDVTPLRTIYDINLGMYGLTPDLWHFTDIFHDKGYKEYMFEKKDTLLYDLSCEGSLVANAKLPEHDDIYYFSYRGYRTFPFLGMEIPSLKTFPLFTLLSLGMGTQNVPDVPALDWRQNDSVINTKSGEAPLGAPRVDVAYHTDPADFKPGIWHVFPAAKGKDHMSFVGWLEKKEDFEGFYRKMYTDVSSVPTINK